MIYYIDLLDERVTIGPKVEGVSKAGRFLGIASLHRCPHVSLECRLPCAYTKDITL